MGHNGTFSKTGGVHWDSLLGIYNSIFLSGTMGHPVPMSPTVYFSQKVASIKKLFEVAIEQTMYIIEHK